MSPINMNRNLHPFKVCFTAPEDVGKQAKHLKYISTLIAIECINHISYAEVGEGGCIQTSRMRNCFPCKETNHEFIGYQALLVNTSLKDLNTLSLNIRTLMQQKSQGKVSFKLKYRQIFIVKIKSGLAQSLLQNVCGTVKCS